MAIGGYLYSGCSVVKGSKTIAQFSLDIHKCRVKAFLDSCARSHCGWSVSRTEGTIDLDSTHQGCIYTIQATDSTGTGYATYFNYKQTPSSEPSGYFLILTLPNWGIVTTSDGSYSSATDVVNVHANNMAWYYTQNTYRHATFKATTCFSSLSLSDFGTHPVYETYIPADATRLMPVASTSALSDSSSESISNLYYKATTLSTSEFKAIVSASSMSFGYATKAGRSDIEEFVKYGNNADSSGWNINLYSTDMSNQNVDSNDTYKLGFVKLKSSTRVYSSSSANPTDPEWNYTAYTTIPARHFSFLNNNGSLSWGVYGSLKQLNTYLGISALPFATADTNRVYSPYLFGATDPSTTGFYSKGFSNVEFLAFSWQSAEDFAFTSNGNYLCVGRSADWITPAFGNTVTSYICTYIGWDSTNPALDSLNACPLYQPE